MFGDCAFVDVAPKVSGSTEDDAGPMGVSAGNVRVVTIAIVGGVSGTDGTVENARAAFIATGAVVFGTGDTPEGVPVATISFEDVVAKRQGALDGE